MQADAKSSMAFSSRPRLSSPASRPHLLLFAALLSFLLLAGCLEFLNSSPTPSPQYNPNATLPPQQYAPPTPLNATAPFRVGLEMTFIDVGYGDATLIRSNNLTVLFDTGPAETASKVIDTLRSKGIEKIDLLVLSSNSPQFTGAAPAVMRQFVVSQLWTNGVNYTDPNSQAIASLSQFVPTHSLSYGFSQTWGLFNLTALNPSDPPIGGPDADSVVLKASYGRFCALLFSNSQASGAAGNEAGSVIGGVDARIVSGPVPINCPVLRVSHHGSGNAASFELLERSGPEVGIISVGPNPPQNAYPEPTLIRRLLLKNVSVYTTDRLGTITVVSDGAGYNITTERPADEGYWNFINSVSFNGKPYWPK